MNLPKPLLRVLNKARILTVFNTAGNITLNGNQFTIPIIDNLGYRNLFMSEPWMIDVLKLILPHTEGIFVDVGANIGQTLLKLYSVSSQITYIGFEPNPSCVYYLNRLIRVNKLSKAQIYPVGISIKTGLVPFFYFDKDATDPAATMISNYKDPDFHHKEFIPVFTFSALKEALNVGDLGILKIDVEGAELEVLQSFESEIKNNQPFIFLEILPAYNIDNKVRVIRQLAIQNLMHNWNYVIYRVIKEHDVFKGLKKIAEIEIYSDDNLCDYVMIPKRKKELFS
jgi:FkbM family methyltransferase